MKPISFPEQTVVFAKDQPQYLPLPAHRASDDGSGRVTFCWKLSWKERVLLLLNGVLWQQVLTFNAPLQPQKLMAIKPVLLPQRYECKAETKIGAC